MSLGTAEFLDSAHRPVFETRPQVMWGTPILLGPLERASLNHWTTHVWLTPAIYTWDQGLSKEGDMEIHNNNNNVVFFRIASDGQSPNIE
jgi:hypothetical protein